jgi:predicted PurR-regulated permease PerM
MAMFIGVKLFSIAGFFLGPIGLIIIIEVMKALDEKDFKHDFAACDEE